MGKIEYNKIGYGLLIISAIFLFLGIGEFIFGYLFLDNFYDIFILTVSNQTQYAKFLMLTFFFLDNIFYIWLFILSLRLIKLNKYSRSLFYILIFEALIKVLSFILFVPLRQYNYPDLMIGIIILGVIFTDNNISRIIKNKK